MNNMNDNLKNDYENFKHKLELKEVLVFQKRFLGIPSQIMLPFVAFSILSTLMISFILGVVIFFVGFSFLYRGYLNDNDYIKMLIHSLNFGAKFEGYKGSDNFLIRIKDKI